MAAHISLKGVLEARRTQAQPFPHLLLPYVMCFISYHDWKVALQNSRPSDQVLQPPWLYRKPLQVWPGLSEGCVF